MEIPKVIFSSVAILEYAATTCALYFHERYFSSCKKQLSERLSRRGVCYTLITGSSAAQAGPSRRGSFPHCFWLLPRDRGSLWSHRSYLSITTLYITPVGCDGKTDDGLNMASRGALLHFGGGIKSGGAILVLTKGPKTASEQEALRASAMVRNGVTACKTGRSRACEAMLKNQISGATDRTLPHALNFG